jgi:hypothetical protein
MANFTQRSIDGSLRLSLSDEQNHATKGENKIMQKRPPHPPNSLSLSHARVRVHSHTRVRARTHTNDGR